MRADESCFQVAPYVSEYSLAAIVGTGDTASTITHPNQKDGQKDDGHGRLTVAGVTKEQNGRGDSIGHHEVSADDDKDVDGYEFALDNELVPSSSLFVERDKVFPADDGVDGAENVAEDFHLLDALHGISGEVLAPLSSEIEMPISEGEVELAW